jgi:two-component system cell cycle sensor histidine kinase/response regulator CckA
VEVARLPLPAYVWRTVDGTLRLVDCNAAASELEPQARQSLGLSEHELEDPNPEFVRALRAALEGQTVVVTEGPYTRRLDQAERCLVCTFVYAPPDTVIVHVDDVTERRAQERDAGAADRRFRAAFTSSPIGKAIISVGPAHPGRIVDVNQAFCEIFGRVHDELLDDLAPSDLSHPDDLDVGIADLHRLMSGEIDRCTFEKRFLHADGSVIAVASVVTLLDEAADGERLVLAHFQDITERKQAEAALAASEARYRQIVETTSEGVWTIDAEHRTTFVNERMAEMLGYTVAEMLGTTLDRYTADGQVPPVREKVSGRPPGVARQHEEELRRRDGSSLWVSISNDSLLDEDGDYAGAIAMISDITERKLAEAELEEARFRFEGAFAAAPTGMALAAVGEDNFGRVLMANAALRDMLGYPEEEIVGRRIADFTHPEDIEGNVGAARWAAENPGSSSSYKVDKRLIRSDGEIVYTDTSASFVSDGQGNALYGVVHLHDVSARRRAEAEVEEREQRFRSAFSLALDAMLIAGDDRRWITGNEAAAQLLGIEQEEIPGRRIEEFAGGTPEQVEGAWQAFLLDGAAAGSFAIRRPDGETREVEYTARAHFMPGRHLSVLRDVTDREQSRREAERLEAALHQAQKLETVGQLAGGVAHDFNNLLAIIINSCDFALATLGDHAAREDVEATREAAERAAGLTRQLLVFSRREIAAPQVLGVNEVVEDVVRLLRRTIGEQIEIDVRLDPGAPAVEVDPSHLEQVLLNLAVNARDAMPDGGTLRIETGLVDVPSPSIALPPGLEPGPYALLVVADTGIGMIDEVVERAFEPFYTTKPKGQGTGLGLATVYGIVKQSGGHIELRSNYGRGTEARVFLPTDGRRPEAVSTADATAPPSGHGQRVLVVEDESGVRDLVRRILAEDGYEILLAADGQEALSLAAGNDIELVVTDVVMPGLSGPQLVHQLRVRRPDLPAIFVSGYTDRPGALPKGAVFVSKPFTGSELRARVSAILER